MDIIELDAASNNGAGYPHRYQGSISFGRGGSQGQRVMKGKKCLVIMDKN